MKRFALALSALAVIALPALGDEGHKHTPSTQSPDTSANAGLDKMKTLVGTWMVADKDGKPTDVVASVMTLTAGGSAIHEVLFPGQPHEMVSMYTADGKDLVMTHYCVLGNQPRMRAHGVENGNQVRFAFDGGTNLDPAKDKHMHAATLTIVDADHLDIDGVGWENGGPDKEMCHGMKLVRKK